MLTDDNEIDQLFLRKLGKYEKTPPSSVWENIEGDLNHLKVVRLVSILKTVGIAATILLAVIAGWVMTNTGENATVGSNNIKPNAVELPVSMQKTADQPVKVVSSAPVSKSEQVNQVNGALSSKIESLAAFAASTSFISKNGNLGIKKSEYVLPADSANLSARIEQKINLAEKITDWIVSSVSGDENRAGKPDSAVISQKPFGEISTERYTADKSGKQSVASKGRWSINAEYAATLNNRSGSYGQIDGINPLTSREDLLHKKFNEKSYSAGMVVGYKITSRTTAKTGIGYRKISLSTRFPDQDLTASAKSIPGSEQNLAGFKSASGIEDVKTTHREVAKYRTTADNAIARLLTENDLKQSLEYVEIPLRGTYKLNNDRLAIALTGGINTDLLVANKALLIANGVQIGSVRTSNLRNAVYSGVLGLDLGYAITNRVIISVEPRFKHYINTISRNNSLRSNPDQLEIAAGVTYCFN